MTDTLNGAGFCVVEDMLSMPECDALTAALAQGVQARGRAGARHLMSNREVAAVASDSRLLGLAKLALGDTAAAYRATLFEKSGRANWLVVWHQDTALPIVTPFESPQWGPWSIKAGIHYAHAPAWALDRIVALRLHLDPSTDRNGPLRVIPGSHRLGVLTDEQVYEAARARPHAECVVPRGGVLAMRPLLIHSSSKAQSGESRRVLHIEYADAFELSPGVCLATA